MGVPEATRRSYRRAAVMGSILAAGVGFISAYLTQPLLSVRPLDLEIEVNQARLERHVRVLSEDLSPRDALHPENLDRVAAFVEQELRGAGARISHQELRRGGTTYRNVIGTFGPDSPERIIVGAHYDAFREHPGADDNASGVAGLLELARLLGRNPPPMRVDLVGYTLEELALLGSAAHARALRQEGVRVRAMFSLEMIGYFSEAPDSQRVPTPLLAPLYPSTGDFIAVVGRLGDPALVRRIKAAMLGAEPDLDVRSINAPRWVPGVTWSDHSPFWDQGFPAVMVTDTALFRNPNYHRETDTADTLDYARMARVVRAVYGAVVVLASE